MSQVLTPPVSTPTTRRVLASIRGLPEEPPWVEPRVQMTCGRTIPRNRCQQVSRPPLPCLPRKLPFIRLAGDSDTADVLRGPCLCCAAGKCAGEAERTSKWVKGVGCTSPGGNRTGTKFVEILHHQPNTLHLSTWPPTLQTARVLHNDVSRESPSASTGPRSGQHGCDAA